ncbi:Anaphase-promoting complex subunit 1 [Cyanidiococcus yangmingshanensis]|uniref:Anaphase-promoting complex subunit 1 n=1 Tax=Cyanidiococcus yangmingshanensis TaxID=2690220 RepID=A0A7J7IND3_9RHOD|nr:Anaphase-promoting complex subunit 1 [Cyanidiococcus yangmingshanensis]
MTLRMNTKVIVMVPTTMSSKQIKDPKDDPDGIDPNQLDGCELPDLVPWLRFRSDRRLWEVQRLLRSSVPMVLDAASERALDEQDPTQTVSRQQAVLFAGAQRTLAAPVGRGAFTAWTGRPGDAAHTVVVPPLVLAGRVAGNQLPIQLDASALAPSYFEWSEFHNAVAAGLRLRPARTNDDLSSSSKQRLFAHPVESDDTTRPGYEARIGAGLSGTTITRAWIRQQRPSRPSATHAGLVLALGLNGHLRRLQVTDWYAYLLPRHELTSIALLLGLAASYRGTAQPLVARLIGLHIRAFNPTGFAQPDWDVSPAVQSAAVIGMGLVFMSTNRKAILEGLVIELVQGAAAPSTSALGAGTSHATTTTSNIRTSTSRDREAHALAAGLALGLVGMPRDTLDRDETKAQRAERCGSSPWVLAPAAGRYVDDLLTLITRTGRGDHGEPRDASTPVFGLGSHDDEPRVSSHWNDPSDASVDTMMLSAPERALGRYLHEPSLQPRAHGLGEPAPDARPSVLLEPERARGDVAAVGALYALMLWYLQSNMEQMARRLGLPHGGRTALWHIRPELILLRSMAAALIRWDAMRPDWTWMLSQLPPVLANQWQQDRTREQEATAGIEAGAAPNQRVRGHGRVWRWRWQVALQNDPIDVAEEVMAVPIDERATSWLSRPPGSCSSTVSTSAFPSPHERTTTRKALIRLYTLLAMTGQALALGLKMTGTADAQAKQLLEELLRVVDMRYTAGMQRSATPWLIACIDNLAVALALVCAGHGTLSVLRRLRRLCLGRRRRLIENRYAYGNHMALHLAIGLLFLGGGTLTLGSSRVQTAMLLMSLYPRYPAAPSDNQYHLQALRHGYVLAIGRSLSGDA